MIEDTSGNLLQQKAEALVNTVNCVGVMGKGIALQFKKAFPENFKRYEHACKIGEVRVGEMWVTSTGNLFNPRFIINFPTKQHWKEPSKIRYIQDGLKDLVRVVKEHHISSIAVPPLGCGNGGLNWSVVHPLIIRAFDELPDVQVYLYGPYGAPEPSQMVVSEASKAPNMTPTRAAIIKLAKIFQSLDVSEEITQIVLQKICYFLQVSGWDLKLQFAKGLYGPYADQLRHVLQTMDGQFLRGVGDGSTIRGEIGIMPNALEAADQFLLSHPELVDHIHEVAQLMEGFSTEYLIELLSTVHWIATQELKQASSYADVVPLVEEWTPRKARLFRSKDIRLGWDALVSRGWLTPYRAQSTFQKAFEKIDWRH